MSDDRTAQAVSDALQDLQIGAASLDKELETVLRSKFEGNIPECPFDQPTLLERLHFLVTSLQRQALQRKTSNLDDLSNLSEDQRQVVQTCQKYLQADYERRRQHMRQRFDVLKAAFGDADGITLIDNNNAMEPPSTVDLQQFLQPSTGGSNQQHVARMDGLSSMTDRGGRVMQEENRNSMPEFSTTPREAAGAVGDHGGVRKSQQKKEHNNKGKNDGNGKSVQPSTDESQRAGQAESPSGETGESSVDPEQPTKTTNTHKKKHNNKGKNEGDRKSVQLSTDERQRARQAEPQSGKTGESLVDHEQPTKTTNKHKKKHNNKGENEANDRFVQPSTGEGQRAGQAESPRGETGEFSVDHEQPAKTTNKHKKERNSKVKNEGDGRRVQPSIDERQRAGQAGSPSGETGESSVDPEQLTKNTNKHKKEHNNKGKGDGRFVQPSTGESQRAGQAESSSGKTGESSVDPEQPTKTTNKHKKKHNNKGKNEGDGKSVQPSTDESQRAGQAEPPSGESGESSVDPEQSTKTINKHKKEHNSKGKTEGNGRSVQPLPDESQAARKAESSSGEAGESPVDSDEPTNPTDDQAKKRRNNRNRRRRKPAAAPK